jgi:hypothetical protein
VRKSEHALKAIASTALSALFAELQARRLTIRCIGIVGAPERNLAAIVSPHIRAHAAEGVLFRKVLEAGAIANNVRYLTFPERQIENIAISQLGLSSGVLRVLPSSDTNWAGRGERTKRHRQWRRGLPYILQMRPNPSVNPDAPRRRFASSVVAPVSLIR